MKKSDPVEKRPYECATDQELKDILKTEIAHNGSDDRIYEILCEIKRRDVAPPEVTPEVAAVWGNFQRKQRKRRESQTANNMHFPILWRRILATAAVFVMLFTAVPPVFGADSMIELVGVWTKELFTFAPAGITLPTEGEHVFTTKNKDLQKIYDVVAAHGIKEKVVPTWIPEGCVLNEIKAQPVQNSMRIHANLDNGSDYISFTINSADSPLCNRNPKEDKNVSTHEAGNIEHFIVSNVSTTTCVWVNNEVKCTIVSSYNKETLIAIINSIYTEVG